MIGYTRKEYTMGTKLVTFKMEEKDKADFDRFCSEVGISVSNAFNMFAKTVVRERRIPFEIVADPLLKSSSARDITDPPIRGSLYASVPPPTSL
jgi:DNA-damage-inducible protein J